MTFLSRCKREHILLSSWRSFRNVADLFLNLIHTCNAVPSRRNDSSRTRRKKKKHRIKRPFMKSYLEFKIHEATLSNQPAGCRCFWKISLKDRFLSVVDFFFNLFLFFNYTSLPAVLVVSTSENPWSLTFSLLDNRPSVLLEDVAFSPLALAKVNITLVYKPETEMWSFWSGLRHSRVEEVSVWSCLISEPRGNN